MYIISSMENQFTVCVVGRPNVGKSTLFNKLTGTRRAIVNNTSGVTRDRMFGRADLEGVSAFIIDTGGFEPANNDIIVTQVREQAKLAIEEADRICLVVDGRAGITPIDREVADLLRRSGKPVVLAVNKLDTPKLGNELADFYELGFEEVVACSAEHSIGFTELGEALTRGMERDAIEDDDEEEKKPLPISVVGCPNVGKSSLINYLIGEDRMAVSNIPGTTRDSVDTIVRWNNREFLFTDTAGIRKKNRISQTLEKYSVVMSLKSISRSKLSLLLLDADKGIREQDIRIAGIVAEEARACIILVNKWDLLKKDSLSTERFTTAVREKMKFLSFAPIVFISAKTGQRTGKIFETVGNVMEEYSKRVDTGPLNRKLEKWIDKRQPPVKGGKRAKIFYASQIKISPPTFSFVCKRPKAIDGPYERYLVNRIREAYGFTGSPIVCNFQERKGRR